MTLPPPPSLYNQDRLGDDDFVANFVARHDILDAVIRRLEATGRSDAGLHHLLIGARGMGKTSLLRRVAIAINRDKALMERYVPLSFREEQYNVLTLGDFWRNCGEAIAEWAEASGRRELADHLDRAMARGEWNEDEAVGELFTAQMRKLGARAVLLVDNLDLVLAALDPEEHWILRRHLQASDGPIMVGAATQGLKESADREAAFYEFFQPHHLDPLDERETEKCMRALAKRRELLGRQVLEVLDRQPERLRTLHNLTGGNPRVLALIYRLLESAETDVAMADLEILLDQVTPYYKARIEEYQTPLQRAVIDAIALNWDPITVGDLSTATNVVTTTLSPMLQKLRRDGLIEQVERSGAYAGHQIVERFLNIWYLMRHGTRRTRQKMRWLVEYLANFYSPDELAELARRYRDSWCADYAVAADEALARQGMERKREHIKPPPSTERDLALSPVSGAGADEVARAAIELNEEAIRLFKEGDFVHGLGLLDDLLARFGEASEPTLREESARALVNKGLALGEGGDRAGEIAIYGELIARFGEASELVLREGVARALVNKGYALGKLGDSAAEIAHYDDLIARFGEAPEPELQVHVARALLNTGIVLGQSGDSAGEIAKYDALIARFGEATEPELQVRVAYALLNKGVALGQSGDSAGEIVVYDALIARFGEAPDLDLQVQVARALLYKGVVLSQSGDSPGEVAVCDAVIARFGEAPDPQLRIHVARALMQKAFAIGEMGDQAKEIEVLDELIARFSEAQEMPLRENVAWALVTKGTIFLESNSFDEAITIYDELLRRFDDTAESALHVPVSAALLNKGGALAKSGDNAGAIIIYDALIARFGEAFEPVLRESVARALFNKGLAFSADGDWDAAYRAAKQSMAILDTLEEERASSYRSIAAIWLADFLIDRREDFAQAEPLLDEAAGKYSELARFSLAWLHLLVGRRDDAARVRGKLREAPAPRLALVDAGLALAADNFGVATKQLSVALGEEPLAAATEHVDDLERLLRLAERNGQGERLIAWLEKSGFADRLAPIHAAFMAYVRGERMLLDVNPEVRQPARIIYERLNAARRFRREGAPKVRQAKGRRRRPRKPSLSAS